MKILLVHQFDPTGPVLGGIDAFVHGIIKLAPSSADIKIIGLSSDLHSRPLGRPSNLIVGGREVEFFPVGHHRPTMRRSGIPKAIRMMLGLRRFGPFIDREDSHILFQRAEYAPFLKGGAKRTLVLHQDMNVIRNFHETEILWKFAPKLYFALEQFALRSVSRVFCVSRAGVDSLLCRLPPHVPQVSFLPTWADQDVFRSHAADIRAAWKEEICRNLGLEGDVRLVTFVGRLDTQKNPQLALRTARALVTSGGWKFHFVFVGEGNLRATLEEQVRLLRLERYVSFLGRLAGTEIARILNASHAYLLTSKYEGMPISVIEALACGVPVVAANVGELKHMISVGRNGFLFPPSADAAVVAELLRQVHRLSTSENAPQAGMSSAVSGSEIVERLLA